MPEFSRSRRSASNRANVWVAHNLIRLVGFQVAEVQLFKGLCYLHFSVFSLLCVSLSVISSMFPSSAGIQFLQQLFNQRLSWSSFVLIYCSSMNHTWYFWWDSLFKWCPDIVSKPTKTSTFDILLPQMSPWPRRYLVDNDLQQYLCCPESSNLIIMCCWYCYCYKIKGLCSLNTNIAH